MTGPYAPMPLTEAAIKRYDEVDEAFDIETDDALAHDALLEQLGREVGRAFGEETKTINNVEKCADLVRPGKRIPPPGSEENFVRRLVRLWREQEANENLHD